MDQLPHLLTGEFLVLGRVLLAIRLVLDLVDLAEASSSQTAGREKLELMCGNWSLKVNKHLKKGWSSLKIITAK